MVRCTTCQVLAGLAPSPRILWDGASALVGDGRSVIPCRWVQTQSHASETAIADRPPGPSANSTGGNTESQRPCSVGDKAQIWVWSLDPVRALSAAWHCDLYGLLAERPRLVLLSQVRFFPFLLDFHSQRRKL